MRPVACLALAALAPALAPIACSGGSDSFPTSDFDSGTGGDDAAESGLACQGVMTNCSGACVDTTSDPANCGGCNVACTGGSCCGSICVLDTPSCDFAVTAIKPKEGNQNGGDWITITGNGFAPGLQVRFGDGVAPALAIDAHTAIALTPPTTVGTYDVSAVSGLNKATLPQSFLFVAGDVVLPWTEKPMGVVRGEDPALAVLQDGRVLVAGGTTVPDSAADALDTAELFTRSPDGTKDSVAPAGGKMSVPRIHDGAITLLDGKVLVVGGAGWRTTLGNPSNRADLFDPSSNTFSPTLQPMTIPRAGIRAALLPDGRALVTSGDEQTAEVFDPKTESFASVTMGAVHTYGFIVRLRDGRVMVGAGDGGVTACEIFDVATGKFAPAAPLLQGRSMLTAHTLPDGRVIVIGGASLSAGGVHVPLDEIELYDPKADKWSVAPYKLSTGRTWHASALVRDGTVLVMGGYDVDGTCNPINTVDQVDPVNDTSKPFGTLPHPNTEWTAVTLLDGSVLGVGGGACGTPTALPSLDFLPGKPGQQ